MFSNAAYLMNGLSTQANVLPLYTTMPAKYDSYMSSSGTVIEGGVLHVTPEIHKGIVFLITPNNTTLI